MKRSDVLHDITNLKGDNAHRTVVDTYNSISPRPRGYKLQDKDPWCEATVSAIFHKQGYDELAECSCPVMVQKAKELGIWVENDAYTPKAGDVIMYDWQDNGKGDNMGNPDHVGFVVKVDGNKITVREGNKGGTVGNRSIDVDGKFIRGYITPRYEDDISDYMAEPIIATPHPEKHEEKAQASSQNHDFVVGKTYTIKVNSALNVRKGAGTKYGLVGYKGLTANAKLHAIPQTGALRNGTRVTCTGIECVENDVWMKIPSGWICAKSGDRTFVK